MLYQILVHTPYWVWAILFVLLGLGLAQIAPRRPRLRRVIVLPLVMTGFSLNDTLSTFGAINLSWVLWIGAALASASWFASAALPAGAQYDAPTRTFNLPGSWTPLGLMMAIFLTKYVVGVMLAMQPALTTDSAAAAMVASVYGALSGVFIGRMARLLRLARVCRPEPETSAMAWG